MSNEQRSFNWRVLDQIESMISERGMTRAEIIVRSGMRRSTFFSKMRGETPLTTEDISRIANAMGMDPMEVIFAAAHSGSDVSDAQDNDLTQKTESELRANYRLAAMKDNSAQLLDDETI